MRVAKPLLWIAVAAGLVFMGMYWREFLSFFQNRGMMPAVEERLRRSS